jgi:ABC-type nitrate/sulfonate/bicarbonate transport system substrate-binding protein
MQDRIPRPKDEEMRSNAAKVVPPAIALAVAIALAGLWACNGGNPRQKDAKIVGTVRLGFVDGEFAVGVRIADELNLFAGNGVKVILRPFEVGIDSYNAMLRGEVDISGPTEYAAAGAALRHEKVRILASIVKTDIYSIVGRKDRGVLSTANLAGKRIGLTRNTIEEFLLGRFLELHGMSMRDVTPVSVSFSESVDAIRNGTVDAALMRPPNSDLVKSAFGDSAVEWPAQSSQWIYGVLVSTDAWIARNPDAVVRLLRALDQADAYILQHPESAKLIVHKRLGLDAESVNRAWKRNSSSLSLDQALIAAMEDETRWMMENNLTSEKTVPDFGEFIYVDGLNAVKPEAVNIIR